MQNVIQKLCSLTVVGIQQENNQTEGEFINSFLQKDFTTLDVQLMNNPLQDSILKSDHLFQIQAMRNINEQNKTRYQNSKDGMLQLFLYPGPVMGIELEKCFTIPDLFEYEGKKVLVKKGTEIQRKVLLLKQKDCMIVEKYEQLKF